MKSLRSMPESLETVNSGLIRYFPENNSSMTSRLSLNLGIFWTGYFSEGEKRRQEIPLLFAG